VDYPSVAGINGVAWDAVELPSQFHENFAWCFDVLARISGHYETGEALPRELFERLAAARNFQAGLKLLRQLEFALFDLRLHVETTLPPAERVEHWLAAVRAEVRVTPVAEFDRFAHGFSHIFGGGYAAGYYSYLWAEVMAADAFAAFPADAPLDPRQGRHFMQSILEAGGSRDMATLFRTFRGRDPSPEAFLRSHGIA
jgi:oligopeptidase A